MILFVCSMGKFRSRTAELLCLFGGLYARCAGTDEGAEAPISDALLREASFVFCMEATHKSQLKVFNHYMASPTVTLGIPDVFNRLDDQLCQDLIFQVQIHHPEVAIAMQKGWNTLKDNPTLVQALGTQLNASSNMSSQGNPAFSVFPSY